MMRKLFFAFIVLVAASASAQNGVTNEFRFGQGEDSIRCLEAISISSINVKNKDFNTAYTSWKTVFTEFPVARVDTYPNGIKSLTELIKAESDPAKKEEYIKELMLVMTTRSSISTSCRRLQRQDSLQVTSLVAKQWHTSNTTRMLRLTQYTTCLQRLLS